MYDDDDLPNRQTLGTYESNYLSQVKADSSSKASAGAYREVDAYEPGLTTTPSSGRKRLVVIDYGEHHRKTMKERRPDPMSLDRVGSDSPSDELNSLQIHCPSPLDTGGKG